MLELRRIYLVLRALLTLFAAGPALALLFYAIVGVVELFHQDHPSSVLIAIVTGTFCLVLFILITAFFVVSFYLLSAFHPSPRL
eukprot:SAG25_NODE_1119_length_3893_cov_4.745124_3_plen_84_part_00